MTLAEIKQALAAVSKVLECYEKAIAQISDLERRRDEIQTELKTLTSYRTDFDHREKLATEAHRRRMFALTKEREKLENVVAGLQKQIGDREQQLRTLIVEKSREETAWDKKIAERKAQYAELERQHNEFKKAVGL